MTVEVVDFGGCADRAAVEVAVGPVVAGRGVDVVVEVLPEGDRFAVQIRVSRREALLWSRDVVVADEECPHLPELVAVTVQQGLASLPGWELVVEVVPRAGLAIAASLGAGPAAPGGQGSLRLALEGEVLGAVFEARAGATTWAPVGTGEGRLDEVLAGLGPWARWGRLQAGIVALGGVGLARGRGFDVDASVALPRIVVAGAVGWSLVGPWVVEVGVDVPVTRFAFVGDAVRLEAPARGTAGIAWMTRSR